MGQSLRIEETPLITVKNDWLSIKIPADPHFIDYLIRKGRYKNTCETADATIIKTNDSGMPTTLLVSTNQLVRHEAADTIAMVFVWISARATRDEKDILSIYLPYIRKEVFKILQIEQTYNTHFWDHANQTLINSTKNISPHTLYEYNCVLKAHKRYNYNASKKSIYQVNRLLNLAISNLNELLEKHAKAARLCAIADISSEHEKERQSARQEAHTIAEILTRKMASNTEPTISDAVRSAMAAAALIGQIKGMKRKINKSIKIK